MLRTVVLFVGRCLSLLGIILGFVGFLIMFEPLIAMAYFPISIVYGIRILILAVPAILLGRLFQWLVHDDWFWTWGA